MSNNYLIFFTILQKILFEGGYGHSLEKCVKEARSRARIGDRVPLTVHRHRPVLRTIIIFTIIITCDPLPFTKPLYSVKVDSS
jgi:hypothetical protein